MRHHAEPSVLAELGARLLSIDETAHVLGVSRATVYRAIRNGSLRPNHVMGLFRFTPEEIRRFVQDGERDDEGRRERDDRGRLGPIVGRFNRDYADS